MLARTLGAKALVKDLTNRVWKMRESMDTCDERELLRYQGGIAVLKEVISIFEEREDERERNAFG